MAPDNKPDTTNRWWEYYFLRYFVGTVVGAVAIVFLTRSADSALSVAGLAAPKDFANWGIKEITGLAALGFAYCYIASTPMLVLHASRALFSAEPRSLKTVGTASGIAIVVIYLGAKYSLSIPWGSSRALGLLGFAVVFGLQLGLIIAAHFGGRDAITKFYWNLASARARNDRSVGEYVESYRHLREHGNSVAIVVLEFILALTITSVPSPALAMSALFLWVFPSTYSWFIGSLLESHLEKRN